MTAGGATCRRGDGGRNTLNFPSLGYSFSCSVPTSCQSVQEDYLWKGQIEGRAGRVWRALRFMKSELFTRKLPWKSIATAFVLSWIQIVKLLGFICAVSVLLKRLSKMQTKLVLDILRLSSLNIMKISFPQIFYRLRTSECTHILCKQSFSKIW